MSTKGYAIADEIKHLQEDLGLSTGQINDMLYREFVDESLVEKNQHEKLAINYLVKGISFNMIAKNLTNDTGIEYAERDVKRFFIRNRQITEEFMEKKEVVAKRHERMRVMLVQKLSNLITRIERMVDRWEQDDDRPAVLGAVNMLNKTLMNIAQIAGILEVRQEERPISVINVVSDKKERLVDKLHRADFIIDVKPETKK